MKRILLIALEELRNILRDQGVFLFVLIVPLAYPLLYAFIYDNETVRDVPVAVVDLSQSPLSRQFTRMLDSTPEVAVTERCGSVEEARELNRRGEVYAIVVIPADLTRSLARGQQGTIAVYADMAGMLYYKSALLAATNVSLALNAELKVERFWLGATDRQEEVATQPIAYDYVSLFNPQSGFAAFLMPPVLMLILQQTLMLGIGMVGGGVRERYGSPVPPGPLYSRPLATLTGRTLFYFVLYLGLAFYMFLFVTGLFGLPSLGRWTTFLAVMTPFILASVFMAMALSSLIYRREDCILLYVFMSVPLLFISGISWPGSAVPGFWRAVGCLFPSTFATNAYVRLNSMGADFLQLRELLIPLWIQTAAYCLLTLALLKRQKKH